MVFLICLRSLSILSHDDLSIEIHSGSSSGNTFEKLTGIAMRHLVMHIHSYLHPLVCATDISAIDIRLSPFSDQFNINLQILRHSRHDQHHEIHYAPSLHNNPRRNTLKVFWVTKVV